MEDREIVQKFLDRDETAIEDARRLYEDYCTVIANNVLHSSQDSEECLNDALLAAWNSIPPHRPENLKTYLGKLVREIAINRWKKNNAQKRIPSEIVQPLDEIEELVSAGDPDAELNGTELAHAISAYLSSVSETKRNVFLRRYWYYDSVDAICLRYGFGKSKVLMILKRTRDGLARYLKKEGLF